MKQYINTLIQVASDCPRTKGTPPIAKRKPQTITTERYHVLINNPYKYTYEQLQEEVHVNRLGKNINNLKIESYTLTRSQLCKKWGWGIHGDEFGRLALVGCETQEYVDLQNDLNIRKLNSSKSSR